MSDEDLARQGADEDFQRWYLGGSPPQEEQWPRHAFEGALFGCAPDALDQRQFLALFPGSTDAEARETGNNRESGGWAIGLRTT